MLFSLNDVEKKSRPLVIPIGPFVRACQSVSLPAVLCACLAYPAQVRTVGTPTALLVVSLMETADLSPPCCCPFARITRLLRRPPSCNTITYLFFMYVSPEFSRVPNHSCLDELCLPGTARCSDLLLLPYSSLPPSFILTWRSFILDLSSRNVKTYFKNVKRT